MNILTNFKNYISSNKVILLTFVIILFMLCMPLFQSNVSVADDYLFHYSRIQSITDSLKEGIFPVKVHYPMANTCGYGTGLFYPNFFLYIPAIINLFISNIALSYKLFLVIILTILFFISYFSIKTVTKNSKTALLSTVLIMCSNGLMLNLYDRTALGELLGFLFITPVICGLYNYVHDNFDKPYILAIGFLGVANAHLITTLICIIFAILYFLINIKSSIKKPKKFLKLVLTATVVILLSASFWLPMLEQLSCQVFKLSTPWTNIKDDAYNLIDLFGTGKFSIGIVITLCIPLLIYGLFDKKIENDKKIFAFFTTFFMFLMVFSPFWKLTNDFSNIIQFKWRLLGITTILSCISIPIFINHYSKNLNFKFNYLFALIAILSVALTMVHMYDVVKNHDAYKNEYIETIIYTIPESIGGGQEYLPVETDYDFLLENSYIASTDTGAKTAVDKEDFKATFFVEKAFNASWIEVPFIYYSGYVSNITTLEGVVTPLEIQKSEHGLLKIIIPEGTYGTINVWYDGTPIQRFSYSISTLTLLCVIISFGIIKHKKASKK